VHEYRGRAVEPSFACAPELCATHASNVLGCGEIVIEMTSGGATSTLQDEEIDEWIA